MKKLYLLLIGFNLISYSCKRESDRLIIRNSEDAEILYYNNPGIKDSFASLNFDKALNHVKNEDFFKAKKLLNESDQIEPNNIIILNGLGNVETALRNFKKASSYFEKAISIDSTNSITYLNYGVSLNKNLEEEKAIEMLKKGMSYTKDSLHKGMILYTIADAYYDLGKYQKSNYFNQKALNLIHRNEIKKDLVELDKLLKEKLD